MRRFDDNAKVVGLKVPELDSYRQLAIRILTSGDHN